MATKERSFFQSGAFQSDAFQGIFYVNNPQRSLIADTTSYATINTSPTSYTSLVTDSTTYSTDITEDP